ncbi:primosomal protein N' [Levilactobacillus yonginensis]|uniref:primosomal protein N' n=1 Tax=Levilactobacillus yonginensis TaxID=1054041 RepID=UPI000F77DAE8|nr:primosomal protein N' [Levilactobacillus yonginensis]
MAQIGQVLVDVPTMQTNDPYSYAIPAELEHQVEVGMRVTVPFGRGKRVVSGVVVGLSDVTNFDGQLKSIQSVLDLAPVLNTELQQLADWLADTTYAFRITCIQTMLPNLLKAQTERFIQPTTSLTAAEMATYFPDGAPREFDAAKLDDQTVSGLLKLQRAGKVEVVYQVKDRAAAKTTTGITPALPVSKLQEIQATVAKKAPKQADLLAYLQTMTAETPVAQAQIVHRAGVSAAVINTAADKGWLTKQQIEVYRDPFHQPVKPTQPLKLNAEQQVAVDQIMTAIDQQKVQNFLVEGVTGSGKTEVYLQSIAVALDQGRTALMLVPEIALTPQMVNRVKARFGQRVAVLHSGLSKGEQYDEWRRIDSGEATVVVGARSAVFAPVKNLGIIIMDEEHESSYKQDENPRYHARDVALWRGQYNQCPVVLGSATPSLETRARAAKGLYTRLVLAKRVNDRPLPPVHIVDMREEVKQRSEGDFSQPLLTAIQTRLDRHEQIVLMLNRRGFSSFVMCRDCGFVLKCPNCDISLTLHMDTHTMKCHYCGHEEAIPHVCPNCHSRKIRYYGTGTQKVEQALQREFPSANILRMDVDSTRRKGAHERILQKFGKHEADILLGTQMIAKGLDFPNVTLVGVLNADTALGLPDFRASERTFQLLTQVSGRAGRASKPGEVFIQTFNPDHYAIQLAQQQDYERFFVTEMHMRHQGSYPPYYFAVQLTASHEEEAVAAKAMFQIVAALKKGLSPDAIILGPTPKAIARVKRKYYYQVVIKYKQEPQLKPVLEQIRQAAQVPARHGLSVTIDSEPMNFM